MKLSTAFSIKKLGLGASALLSAPGKWGPMGVVARARVCSVLLIIFALFYKYFVRVMLHFGAHMFLILVCSSSSQVDQDAQE